MGQIDGKKVKVEITPTSGTAEAFEGYLTNARFSSADAASNGDPTFGEVQTSGGTPKDWSFAGTARQDDTGDADAFMTFHNAHVGEEVTVVIMPQGNSAASATQPHWSGTATVGEFDGDFFGGAPSTDGTKWTYDFSWALSARPTIVTA